MASDLSTHPADDTTDDLGKTGARPRRVRVECAGLTHPGKVRPNNEDNFLIAKLAKSLRVCGTSLPRERSARFSDEEGYLLVVADGMGGVAGGEHASRLAVEAVEAFVLDVVKWFLHLGGRDEKALLAELRQAFERADRTVIDRAERDWSLSGMGTTLTMAYSVGADLFVVHAGDSRAYLFRDGELEQISRDHNLAQLMVDAGALSPEAARRDRRRNIVTNVIGGPQQGVHAEIHKVALRDGDALLLCTDGLSEPVDDRSIAEILARHADPDSACQALIDAALERGAPDNVTAVLARYEFD